MKEFKITAFIVTYVMACVIPLTFMELPKSFASGQPANVQKEVAKEAPKAEAVKAEAAVQPAEAPKAEEPAASPNFLDKLIAALKNAGGVVAGLLVVFEVALRVVPTAKPLSVLIPVKGIIEGLAFVLAWWSELVGKLIGVANKVKEK